MSAPVDMLAVKLLRGFQSSFGPSRPDDDEEDAEVWDQIDAACEAVAELIAADREYDDAIAAAKELNHKIAESGWFEVEFDALRKSGERIVRAQMRRAKALDVIGGAA